MSKVLENKPNSGNEYGLSHYVKTDDGKLYYVDSRFVAVDQRYETMAVECNIRFYVSNKSWMNPVVVEYYHSENEMRKSHEIIIHNLELYRRERG